MGNSAHGVCDVMSFNPNWIFARAKMDGTSVHITIAHSQFTHSPHTLIHT